MKITLTPAETVSGLHEMHWIREISNRFHEFEIEQITLRFCSLERCTAICKEVLGYIPIISTNNNSTEFTIKGDY